MTVRFVEMLAAKLQSQDSFVVAYRQQPPDSHEIGLTSKDTVGCRCAISTYRCPVRILIFSYMKAQTSLCCGGGDLARSCLPLGWEYPMLGESSKFRRSETQTKRSSGQLSALALDAQLRMMTFSLLARTSLHWSQIVQTCTTETL